MREQDDNLVAVQQALESEDGKHYDLVVMHGDSPEYKDNFWKRLYANMAGRSPYLAFGGRHCIFVCDKNCPPGLPTEVSQPRRLQCWPAQLAVQLHSGCSWLVPASRLF